GGDLDPGSSGERQYLRVRARPDQVQAGLRNAPPYEREDVVGELERRVDIRCVAEVAMEYERRRLLLDRDRVEVVRIGPVRDQVDPCVRHGLPDGLRVGVGDHCASLEPWVYQALIARLVIAQELVVELLAAAASAFEHLATPQRPRVVKREDL